METIRKILAEIERLKEVMPNDDFQPTEEAKINWLAGKLFTLVNLEVFIESLEEEQDVDLEKEYESFVTSDPVYSKLTNGIVGKAIARHFYELGCRHAAVLYDDMEKERQRRQESEQDKELQQAMAYAIDYCQRNGTNITTEEVWREWCKDVEEANS